MGDGTAASAAPPSPRRARGDRTRAALVEVALRLFADKGVEATAVDEVTAGASVAKGTFYVHFQRKEDVLLEAGAALVDRLDALDLAGDARQALATLGSVLAERLVAAPRHVVGWIVREIVGNRDEWLRVLGDRKNLAAVIEPVVRRGQAAGQLRSDLSPQRLAQSLTILWLDSIIGWAEDSNERPPAPLLARATTLFLEGAVPRR